MKHTVLCGQQNILNKTVYPVFCKASSEMRKSLLLFLRSCQCFVNISDIYDYTHGFDYNLQEAQESGHILFRGDYFINCNFFVVVFAQCSGSLAPTAVYKGKSTACRNNSEPATPSENKPILFLAWVPEPGSFEGMALLHVAVCFGPGPGDDNSLYRR